MIQLYFCMSLFSFLNITYWKDCPYLLVYPCLLCHRLINHISKDEIQEFKSRWKRSLVSVRRIQIFLSNKKSTWHFLNFSRNAVWFLGVLANVALMSVSQCCSVPYAKYYIIEITDLSWPSLTISFDKFGLCWGQEPLPLWWKIVTWPIFLSYGDLLGFSIIPLLLFPPKYAHSCLSAS